MLNLVDNAVKFTDDGEVVVDVAREQRPQAGTYLHISVKDTGIGILKEEQAGIFKAFKQLDAGPSHRHGGTGLGLAVTGQLVRLMGGRIWVESEPGNGSTFHFTTRFSGLQDNQETVKEMLTPGLQDIKTLIVDDNTTSRNIITEMLEGWKMSAITAAGIDEAKQILTKAEENEHPVEVILIDSSLPDKEGFELTRWINGRSQLDSKVIMMLTFTDLRANAYFKNLGLTTTIMKPVRPSDLQAAIMFALEIEKPGLKSEDDALPRKANQPLKILVAEDTPFNQKFILRLLGRWGHQTVMVENGLQVLEALDAETFDLVIMDVRMPEMDGYEASRKIRESEKTNGGHIPIIAITAHAVKGDRERCLEAGMDEYVSKPISSDKLFEIIETLAAGKSPDMAGTDNKADTLNSFDKQTLIDAFDHDWGFFKEVVDLFVSDYPRMMVDIRQAFETGDTDALIRTAHSLKGMLSLFNAQAAAQKTIKLQELGKQGEFSEIENEIEALSGELSMLKSTLQDLVAERAS
jgi:CheY-like chemotaxis protein